jgi:VanZ family protein
VPEPRDAAILWLLVALFIVYGSLYPFRFKGLDAPGAGVAHLLTTSRRWDHPADLLANILLYVPFGLFGCAALPARLRPPHRLPAAGATIVLAGGVLLSTSLELVQFYDRGRDSTLGDVYANAIGTGAGVAVAILFELGRAWPGLRGLAADRPAAAVLAMWFAYRLYPYVPTISLSKYAHALAAVATEPLSGLLESSRFAIAWLLVAVLIERLYGAGRTAMVFASVAAVEFLGRVLILDVALSLKDVAGAAVALVLWALLASRRPARLGWLAAAMTLLVVAERLAPFRFAPGSMRAFGWVPALSLMQGSIGVAIQAFCEKVFAYGGLIWLWWRGGVRLGLAAATVAAVLGATSYAQTRLANRSAEVTDAVLALTIGGVFSLLDTGRRGRAARTNRAGPDG